MSPPSRKGIYEKLSGDVVTPTQTNVITVIKISLHLTLMLVVDGGYLPRYLPHPHAISIYEDVEL